MSFKNDIPTATAVNAHNGTSFSPEKRGESERQGYSDGLKADFDGLSKLATTPDKQQTLTAEFSRYREGMKIRTIAYLNARSRCLSFMITGPSNFPSSRNEKRNRSADNRYNELTEYRDRALRAIRKALTPELAPIMAGDKDAAERLKDKIEKAEKYHQLMKDTNKALRKHSKDGRPAQIDALIGLGRSEKQANQLTDPAVFGGTGCPRWELTNNSANIRRMKARLVKISRDKETKGQEIQGKFARLEDCPPDNRVRLFFPDKPDTETRKTLKSSGFRWAPSIGCWQAYRNQGTYDKARDIAGL